MSDTDNINMRSLTQDGMASVVAAQQVEIAGLTKSIDQLNRKMEEQGGKLDAIVEYINIQKGQKQMAAFLAGSLGLTGGGVGSILVWIGMTLFAKGHP